MVALDLAGEIINLLPQKAAYFPERKILLISDVHVGKVMHFRKNGIGIPAQALKDNFDRMRILFDSLELDQVVFLGDLFHSDLNNEWHMLQDLLSDYPMIEFVLVQGNHDILDESIYASSALSVQTELELGDLILSHEPMETIPNNKYNIYGHIHPAVRLSSSTKSSLRLACFLKSEHYMIMPAFGTFTGMAVVKPLATDQVFVIADDTVIEVA